MLRIFLWTTIVLGYLSVCTRSTNVEASPSPSSSPDTVEIPVPSPSPIVTVRPATEVDNERLFTLTANEFFSFSSSSTHNNDGNSLLTVHGYGSTLFRLHRAPPTADHDTPEFYKVVTFTRQWLRRRMVQHHPILNSSLSLVNLNSADIVYTDNGHTVTNITIIVRGPPRDEKKDNKEDNNNDQNSTTTATATTTDEMVSELPIFGRMYWITYEENYTVIDTNERIMVTTIFIHKLVVNAGIPRNELSIYRHSYATKEQIRTKLPPEPVVTENVLTNGTVDTESSTAVEIGTDGSIVAAPSLVPRQPAIVVPSPSPLSKPEPSSSPSPVPLSLRVMTYNVWNSNPPKWLWRDHRDRFRQYALRIFTLADNIRLVQPDIIALQEVRYDTSLGSFDNTDYTPENNYDQPSRFPTTDGTTNAERMDYWNRIDTEIENYDARFDTTPVIDRSVPYDVKLAWGVATLWYNRTCSFADNPRYINRNIPKWNSITQSNGWNTYGTAHYLEGTEAGKNAELRKQKEAAAALAAMDPHELEERSLFSTPTPPPPPPPPGYSPYNNILPRGPPSFSRIQRSMLIHPHSQMEHIASFFPEYQFVYTPGQLYFDKNDWTNGHSRDEEGPAVMSKYPIVQANYILLSRNTSDEGDGHQRLCLHAVIDVSESLGLLLMNRSTTKEPYLVDIYTIHLSLSEIARNRTVLELESYIHHSAKGKVTILTGDMNAEPHEPAMQRLQGLPIHLQQQPSSSSSSTDTVTNYTPSPIQLRDVWLHKYPEPVPRDKDPSVRRYAFTFPSDDPVKRIDLMYVGYPHNNRTSTAPFCANEDTDNSSVASSDCITINEVYVVGQDALPGTEATEGHGHGMVSDRSPIYGSDHRGVVTHITLPKSI